MAHPMATVPVPLRDAPFSLEEALVAGLTRRSLQGPAVRRLFRGVYCAAGLELTQGMWILAAAKALPYRSLVTGVTALQALGIDLGPHRPLCLVTDRPQQVRQPGLQLTRVQELPPHRGRLVAPEVAFGSAALVLDLVDLVAAGDALIRVAHTTPEALVAASAQTSGRGSVLARRAARLVRERVDSIPETRLRLLLVLAGLPEPECNLRLGSEVHFIGRVDLVYQRHRLILEYEGDQHFSDRDQWNSDIGRYEDFAGDGWTVIRVTRQRMRSPRALVLRVFQVLRAAGYAGSEPSFSAEWSSFFERV